ncbi:hypothetical protein FVIR_GE00502 [Candidatus Gullanella endobia]|uniref:UPF0250 protein FVIR_GE00502 n=1 Tax=Candidatus Gullanella endobia TaxID=1070130 RepID=A0A143WRW6_9ENTR|nr:DUF493 family protein YbeD [Candidatus Gullanella endobia]CUX96341.1 hypothetical protein FVIR_GE00502 [Candidatus Gullanella endobia]
MKTNLNKLLKFPCSFTYKVIGIAQVELLDQVVKIIQYHAPGDYLPQVKFSKNKNYFSISISITAIHIKQIETIYEELSKIDTIRIVI